MESRRVTNLLLLVIAATLVAILFRAVPMIPEAHAQSPIDRGFPYQLVMGCYSDAQKPCVPTALRVDASGTVYVRQ